MGEAKYRKATDPNYGRRPKDGVTTSTTIRGRNLAFLDSLANVLQLDGNLTIKDMSAYKGAFTRGTVRKLNEEIVRLWPKNTDIEATLKDAGGQLAGLYVGDYAPGPLLDAVVRHSTYATKILIVDPFIYPFSVRDEYNPILNPDEFRTQTLKCANLWIKLAPWIRAGIVEVIRTPCDFDSKLQWEMMEEQYKKFEAVPELSQAAEESTAELMARHSQRMKIRHLVLSLPDQQVLRHFETTGAQGVTKEDILAYVNRLRLQDPDFLEPMGPTSSPQVESMGSGAAYNTARLTASLTGAYLLTDLKSKWKEIEYDRRGRTPETSAWSPFAKAVQDTPFKYLNQVSIEDALAIRVEGRLEDLRTFLRRVWKQACDPASFDNVNAVLLADELQAEVRRANEEWKQIDRELIKYAGAVGSSLAAAGTLIGTGAGEFLAAGAVLGGLPLLAATAWQRRGFQDKFPAAFFLRLGNKG